MRKTRLIFFFLGCSIILLGDLTSLRAQVSDKGTQPKQLQLIVDNDAYFFTSYDRYYSSGIFASYSASAQKLPFQNTGSAGNAPTRLSYDLTFSHYIYTPKDILWDRLDELDRPYAGMATLGLRLNYFKPSAAFSLKADAGWLGPAIKTGELMRWWHKSLRIRQPRGWEYQINNTPVLILSPEYKKQWPIVEKLDFISSSAIVVGTVLNQASQQFAFRYGSLNGLNQSHFTNSLMGIKRQEKKLVEWYLLAAVEGNLVLYNATIDGNFIGAGSRYTEESETVVLRQTYGAVLAYEKMDFELSFKTTSREVRGAEHHRYMRAKISYRF